MTLRFPIVGFTTQRIITSLTGLVIACMAMISLAGETAPGETAAGTTATLELKPYKAEYLTTAMGLSMTLFRELARDSSGSYKLTSTGKKFVFRIEETSIFRIDDKQLVPESYIYQLSGLVKRRREVHFVPGSDTIRSLKKGEWYDLPYTENTYDRMSQQEQSRLKMLTDYSMGDSLVVTVADGKSVDDYQLDFVGEETIDTPTGPIDTLHFERLHDNPDRSSDTWVAPELDYLMVKTVHVEDGKPVEVVLSKISMGDANTTTDR